METHSSLTLALFEWCRLASASGQTAADHHLLKTASLGRVGTRGGLSEEGGTTGGQTQIATGEGHGLAEVDAQQVGGPRLTIVAARVGFSTRV